MPLQVQGPRDLSPLEAAAVYLVFGVPPNKHSIAPSEFQLEVVESIGGPDGQGLRNINQEMVDPSIQRSLVGQQGPRKPVTWGEIKQVPLKPVTWITIKQVQVDSTYDRSGLITISRSAFPHTDDLREGSTLRNTEQLKPANIHYLSTLIYQCTRYWQWTYDLHMKPIPKSGSAYHFTKSHLMKAKKFPGLVAERHASAAQVYFVLAWQLRYLRPDADVNLTSQPPDSVGPVDRYDEIAHEEHNENGQRIVPYELVARWRNDFRDYILDLQDAGARKRFACAEAMQPAHINRGSRFYKPRE